MEYKPQNVICQNCKTQFTIEPDDFGFYEKIGVPPPTFCPECRMIRRFNFRNESMLFRKLDTHSEKEIFSSFSPDADIVIYENSYWFSDDWNKLKSGYDYDFSKPFFEQYKELISHAPFPARSFINMINSDYCNEMSYSKNCYLCFNADYLENSAYLRKANHAKDCFDLYEGFENELCYEDVMVDKSYKTLFSIDCESCVDVWFSKGLRGCTNCFGCVNLINKSYYFFNEKYNKEEYFKKLEEFKSDSYNSVLDMWNRALVFWVKFPVKYARNIRTVNSTGERIFDSKNVKDSYSVRKAENMRFCQDIQSKASNSYDYSVWGDGAENIYECIVCGFGAYNLKFCFHCYEEVYDLEYCGYCFSSKNCFGCVGLHKKEYCIFNKQYSKEDYFILKEKIIKQMNNIPYIDNKGRIYKYGELFPYELSPLAYNESLAQVFFPLESNLAKDKGYIWRDINRREYKTTINSKDLPDNISEVDDKILEEIIKCESCEKAYRITKIEFQFYKRIPLPLPRLCHDCRFTRRFKFVNPLKLWHRKCMKEGCNNEFETSYAPERPEIVYCEKCYQAEVY